MRVNLDQGETRHIKLKIINKKNEPFSITAAQYELTPIYGNEVLEKGQAAILDHILDVVITPPRTGIYRLAYTYIIGDETLVDVVEVHVT